MGYTISDFCTHGCVDGMGGNKCYNKCPDDCVTCEQAEPGNCATCQGEKYLSTEKRCVGCPETCSKCQTTCQECKEQHYNYGQSTNCSLKCPSNCKTCTSSFNCQECYAPFYNQGDITNCSLSCPGNCLCSTPDVCSACQDGYFNVNGQCNRACLDKCRTCSDQSNCQFCKDGYYKGRENITKIEVIDCSLPCRDTCATCTSYDSCTTCKQGFYGSYCQNNCSVGCTNGECEKTYGSCKCNDAFIGSNCNECATGRHGEQCDKYCPVTCKGGACRRETGNCLECEFVNITGDTCNTCVYGTWGTHCTSECPRHCGGQCIRNSGYCYMCEGYFQGDKCDHCIKGLYSGDKCCMRGGHCRNCSSYNLCETCDHGYYGEKCDKTCPTTCTNDGTLQCKKALGNCISCFDGFHGEYCNMTCSVLCFNSRCLKENGHCADGCVGDFEGPTCMQGVDTTYFVGVSVGISSSITIGMMIILTSVLFLILRRRKHRKRQNQMAQVSYMNTELQPVTPDPQANILIHQEYEDLRTRNERDDTDYDQINAAN